jgi:hypothetical protein
MKGLVMFALSRVRSLVLPIAILGVAVPALASAATSSTNVALRSHPGDGATLTLAKKVQTALRRGRVTLGTQGAAKHNKTAYSLPDKAGSWNFATATGTVVLNGGLGLHHGHRTVKLSSLKFTRTKTGNGKVTALVGGKSVQLFVIKGHAKVKHTGARETLSGLTASLTKAGAAKINKALHINAVHSGESLGAFTVTVTKSGATVAPTSGVGMSFAREFRTLTNTAGISVVPIAPSSGALPAPAGTTTIPAANGTAVSFPLAGSSAAAGFDRGTLTGSVPLSGGLQLDNGAASATLTNPDLTIGTGTEGSSLSFQVNGGPQVKLFDLDTSQLEQAAAPNGSLDLKGLLATLSSEGASSLNTALGTDAFTTGTPVGGLTVILPASKPPSS